MRRDLQDRITPPIYGWHNIRCPDYVAQERIEYRAGAKKFEAGSQNLLGLVGLRRSMELLLELGIDNIAQELLRKRAFLAGGLQGLGYTVLGGDAPLENASAIVSCHREGTDMPALHGRLTTAKIITSLRRDRSGQHYIRFSPHFYNTDAELARVLEFIKQQP